MITSHPNFQTTVYGKWILAGEHAVLRGHPAIIFPVKEKSLVFKYWHSEEEVRADFGGDFGDEMQFLFWSVIERAVEILNIQHANLTGRFHLENNIPIGAGMGASAALCVAVGRWFVDKKLVPIENLHEFARQLENLFHNESSGADIAVCIAGKAVYFSRSGGLHPIKPNWSPKWYLSFSEKNSTTARSVKKVKELWQQNPQIGNEIDEIMAKSVSSAEEALSLSAPEGLALLIEAINNAKECFKRWSLIEDNIERHIEKLIDSGALAAKPTGSGDGGFILSLWKEKPPADLDIDFIAA